MISSDSPVKQILNATRWTARDHSPAYFDLLPASKDQCRVFMLAPELLLETTAVGDSPALKKRPPNYTHTAKDPRAIGVYMGTHVPDKPMKWKREEIIPVPFNEPFIVAAKGDHYFFTTESGKVYIAKKQANGPRKVELLWGDKDRPIELVFADNDKDKTYVFGREHKAIITAKQFYFELAEKPKVVEFTVGDLKKPEKKLPPPLADAWQFQQLLKEREK
jgi:hypothetical protein